MIKNQRGEGTYKSSKGKITLKNAEDKVIETVTGKGNPTTIDAVWGFMTHDSGTINVLDGTVVNAEEAIFLHKRGGVSFIADDSKLNAKSGILLQMIDNDDTTVGMGDASSMGFNTEFNEKADWPSENGSVTESGAASGGMGGGMPGGPGGGGGQMSEGDSGAKLILTNSDYKGDVFNGSGYWGQSGNALEVTVGTGATINEYYYLGHVENRNYRTN